jgi:glycosyltransferase involved in cell wall biosynthesis
VSEAEGYGLPAVVAAACGTPVIATRESPLPELLADGGIFVAPGDERTLVQAMLRLASDERERDRLAANALRAARGMTWDRAAASALDALHDAARGGRVTPNGADSHENAFPITVAV